MAPSVRSGCTSRDNRFSISPAVPHLQSSDDNPYAAPARIDVSKRQKPSPFFSWPVSVAAVGLGLLVASIYVGAIYNGVLASLTQHVFGVSLAAGFFLVGVGSLLEVKPMFNLGFALFLVWTTMLLKMYRQS